MFNKRWVALSPEEREEYVSQDYVPQKELTFSFLGGKDLIETFYQGDIPNDPPFCGTTKSYVMIIYEMYFLDHRSPSEISYHIPYGIRYIQYIVKAFKKRINETGTTKIKLKVLKEHFINNTPVKDIPRKLKVDRSYVLKIISSHIDLIKSSKNTNR